MTDKNEIITSKESIELIKSIVLALSLDPIGIAELTAILVDKSYTAIQRIPYTQMKRYIDGVKKVEDDLGGACKLSDKLFSDPDKREDNAMRVYKMVTSTETTKKIDYMINATRSMLLGLIDVEMMFRIFQAINETLPEDLVFLSNLIEQEGPFAGNIRIHALSRAGLMITAGIDSNADVEEQGYHISSLGYMVDKYSLSLNDEDRWKWHNSKNKFTNNRKFIGSSFSNEEEVKEMLNSALNDTAKGLFEEAQQRLNDNNLSKIELLSRNKNAISLLIYATKTEGKLNIYNDLMHTNPLVEIGEYILPDDDDAKESAIWTGAVRELENMNMIECTNYKQKLYRLTDEGWNAAEIYILENELNEEELNSPQIILETLK